MRRSRSTLGTLLAGATLLGAADNAAAQQHTHVPSGPSSFHLDVSRGATVFPFALYDAQGDSIREIRIPRAGDELRITLPIANEDHKFYGQNADVNDAQVFSGRHVVAVQPQNGQIIESSQDIPLELYASGDFALLDNWQQYVTGVTGPNGHPAWLVAAKDAVNELRRLHPNMPYSPKIELGVRQVLPATVTCQNGHGQTKRGDDCEESLQMDLWYDNPQNLDDEPTPIGDDHQVPGPTGPAVPSGDQGDGEGEGNNRTNNRPRGPLGNHLSVGGGFMHIPSSTLRNNSSDATGNTPYVAVAFYNPEGDIFVDANAMLGINGTYSVPEAAKGQLDFFRANATIAGNNGKGFAASGELERIAAEFDIGPGTGRTETRGLLALGLSNIDGGKGYALQGVGEVLLFNQTRGGENMDNQGDQSVFSVGGSGRYFFRSEDGRLRGELFGGAMMNLDTEQLGGFAGVDVSYLLIPIGDGGISLDAGADLRSIGRFDTDGIPMSTTRNYLRGGVSASIPIGSREE